ncbi:MAG: monomeric [FeFe] hydrogenase [Anaerohalosphaeraceae bacterium]
MNGDNNVQRNKRRLLIETAALAFRGRLAEEIDALPVKLFPKGSTPTRCCIYKSRAITRYRLMAVLGYSTQDETDECTPLSEYVRRAEESRPRGGAILTVINEACSACLKGRHYVTNVCRGCVARPCVTNCPKQAVQIISGRARIDEERCVNCGLCLQQCPYHAIVYVPIPCEEACPVGAICKGPDGHEQIDEDKCIDCGKCLQACPFAAIAERSQMVEVIRRLREQKPIAALLAPAVAGQFPQEFSKLVSALLKMGFTRVVEVAAGAEMTARHESRELQEKIGAGQAFLTSSCCPAYVQAVRKHIPALAPFVSQTPSPMHFTARQVKQQQPDMLTVFIGPCIAKRREAADNPYIDYVLTTDELGAMLVAAGIELADCPPAEWTESPLPQARAFAVSGGVAETLRAVSPEPDAVRPMLIDGLDKKSLKLLSLLPARGTGGANFVEVMSCSGGCVAGPCNISQPKTAARKVRDFAGQQSPAARAVS